MHKNDGNLRYTIQFFLECYRKKCKDSSWWKSELQKKRGFPLSASFGHNFEINFVHQIIKNELNILTEFVHLIVMNLNPCFEIFHIIRERKKSFGTSHKKQVTYTNGALSRWVTLITTKLTSFCSLYPESSFFPWHQGSDLFLSYTLQFLGP